MEKCKQFLLLSALIQPECTISSIPPLPINQLENPVILTYRSFLLLIFRHTLFNIFKQAVDQESYRPSVLVL